MNICKFLFCCFAAAFLAITLNSAEPKKKASSAKPKANYRQSISKKATTVTNPHAITAKKKQTEDPAATKAFQAFSKNAASLKGGKKYGAIYSAADKLLASQKKLTADQKSSVYYIKADAYLAEKKYENAIKTANSGIAIGGKGAASCAAVIINANLAEKKIDLAEKTIARFESTDNFGDYNYYLAIANLRFTQKRYEEAFENLKSSGRQPNLTNANKIQILNGFGKYYIQKKNYKYAIAQYLEIKELPKIDPFNEGNADLQIADCYLKLKNKNKALEIYNNLLKSKHSAIRSRAQSEIKKLSPKQTSSKQAKKKSSSRKKK